MNLDAAINKTIIECQDRFSSNKMASVLYYNLFNDWAYNAYEITDTAIIDSERPYNDNPYDELDSITIDVDKFHEEITELGYIHCSLDYDDTYVNLSERIIIVLSSSFVRCVCTIVNPESDALINIRNCVHKRDIEENKVSVGILVQKNGSHFIDENELEKMNIDVNKTYNDDIPVEAIDDFIENDTNGLMLFYGKPGTGKTTYIRHLIQEHPNKNFVILDSNLLYDINSHSLLNIFIERKNSIYIIEDCEKLLVSRDNERNPIISAFLNMTDGILANVINCKFICTFNTDLENIDEAIKRKGRLKLKYEFKKLACDKCKKIESTVDESMTIADLIHIKKENDFSKKSKKKIGFGQ